MDSDSIVIVSAARTAVGKFNGALKEYSTSDLGGFAIKEAIARAGVRPETVDEAIMGCEGGTGENAYMTRLAAVKGGMSYDSAALTVNRLCASGLQSIVTAAMELQAGFSRICVAGGAESMTNMPYFLEKARFGYHYGPGALQDNLHECLSDPFHHVHMGITAENVAKKYGITRGEQDEYALLSQQRAKAAVLSGAFVEQIVPVTVTVGKHETAVFEVDEHPRMNATLESLAKLKPAFLPDGTVTAGNSSGLNDAGAAVLMMKENLALEMGLRPMVRFRAAAVAGVDPLLMGTGPIPAVRKLLAQTGVRLEDIGVIELNEAFAAQTLACIRELNLDPERVNTQGSGISLGHPVGATGCIIAIKAIYRMLHSEERYGLATLCVGGGQGMAALFERCEN
ncbi:MAG: thiolase family protein [Clostridiales bacterium]|nr:thiolase family protein [Clostridiales bacterium]